MSKTIPSSLDKYRELVREMIQQNDPDLLSNISTAHAKIIVQELIRSAQSHVRIVCSRFAEDVWDDKDTLDAIDETCAGLTPKVIFKVATKTGFPEATKCVTKLKNYGCEFFNAPEDIPDFCVVDGERFRVETDMENRKAQVCFYDKTLGSILNSIFEKRVEKTNSTK